MSTQAAGGTVPEFTVGDRLRKAREVSGMDQGQLAEAMGVSRRTVSNNESGHVKPRVIVIRAWAMATGVSVDWIETGEAPTVGPHGPGGGVPVTSRYVTPPAHPTHLRYLTAA